jgi:hypothetical protein
MLARDSAFASPGLTFDRIIPVQSQGRAPSECLVNIGPVMLSEAKHLWLAMDPVPQTIRDTSPADAGSK